jgi:hypothetical protein
VNSYFTLSCPLHRAVAFDEFKQEVPVSAHGLFREEIVRGPLIGHAMKAHMLDDLLQLLEASPSEIGSSEVEQHDIVGLHGIANVQQLIRREVERRYSRRRGDPLTRSGGRRNTTADPELIAAGLGERVS